MRLPPADFLKVVELTPLVSIDLVVSDARGRILVGRRTNRPARGYWFVPGGRVGKNEAIRAAFERLTEAELGTPMPIDRGRFLGVFEHLYEDNFAAAPGFGTHYVVLAYAVRSAAAELALPPDQHSGYLWLDPGEILSRDDVHENTKAYCRL